MKFSKYLVVFLIVMGINSTSQAGIYLEPYLGYNGGTIKGNVSSVPYSDGMTGMVLGGRVGYKMMILWAALDYSMGSGLKSELANQTGGKSSIDVSKTALTVAFTGLPLVSFWGGYILSASMKMDDLLSTSLSGKGTKLGVGFTMLPFVSLNLEYMNITYDDKGTFTSPEETAVLASVSIPFDL